jgi:hypothetical protein
LAVAILFTKLNTGIELALWTLTLTAGCWIRIEMVQFGMYLHGRKVFVVEKNDPAMDAFTNLHYTDVYVQGLNMYNTPAI